MVSEFKKWAVWFYYICWCVRAFRKSRENFLTYAKKLLEVDGKICISIPNLAHNSVLIEII